MAWRSLSNWLSHLEKQNELLRIDEPVDVELEVGAIADRLVKGDGPAVIFEKPRLPDGSISEIPLVMNIFGNKGRTLQALGAKSNSEVGERLVALMKPDIGGILRKPWTGIPLLRDALSMPPKKKSKGACQRIKMDLDVTKLPFPKTWPLDGGRYITLPLVVTKNPVNGEHNLGMYRGQIFGPTEVGVHWQIHKHGADHADAWPEGRMPVAICVGGPPELIFSAIAPLPDNLEEYMFAGFLGRKRLPITKALTQDLLIPANADIVIEGWIDVNQSRTEGPFGDHFGFYSLTGQYPVLNVTAITRKKNAILPATIVGQPPMEDGYLGEAVGAQFLPVLQFQHRDVMDLYLPLETGFHNLAIVKSKQRYPRQARKTCLGLLGAGQMMFLKIMVATDEKCRDLELLLDVLNDRVDPNMDLTILDGMVGDSLEPASTYENVHSKLIIDATRIIDTDPRSGTPVEGSFVQKSPDWRLGKEDPPGISESLLKEISLIENVEDCRLIRPSMLVITTNIDGSPNPRSGTQWPNEKSAAKQREQILQLRNSIWQLDSQKELRWLFITDSDLDLHGKGAKRRLLWQLTSRFAVERDLFIEDGRICWDATIPIPCHEGPNPVRRWPAITMHDPSTLEAIERFNLPPWPNNLVM
ncbi:MAG: UbiD family decarboxylase [Candidatus Poseidoniaceae archaeon]|jgi:4-hydroxy-3-polyprenylbenzoate decarboxylase|nr:UbiD family decarboxylase [Candidatus Poseidoniaceae archaeon]